MEHFFINDKIRLEKVKISMAETIFNAIESNRQFLRKWLPFIDYTNKVDDTERFILSVIKDDERNKNAVYSIWYKEEFAGLIGFKDTDWANHKTEFGYWLVEKMQGKGIITKTIKTLLSYSFNKLGLNRIQIKVALGNHKSAAIPKRLGFVKEGIEREGEFHQNKYYNLQVFSLLKKNWIA